MASDTPFKCEKDIGEGGWKVSADTKLKDGLKGLGRSPARDLETVVFAVNGITKHQVMSLSELAHEKKALELAAMNRAQLRSATARDDKSAILALTATQANLERRAAMHKAAARAHAVASEQSMLVAQNLETVTGRSRRGMNGLGDIGSDEDVRRRKEAAMALHTQLTSSAGITFDGKSIAGKGWVDAFRNAVRKGYDVPMPQERMSAPRVGIGTDTETYAARENYVGATLQGLGDDVGPGWVDSALEWGKTAWDWATSKEGQGLIKAAFDKGGGNAADPNYQGSGESLGIGGPWSQVGMCRNPRIENGVLYAECKNIAQKWVPTSFYVASGRCNLDNINGQLTGNCAGASGVQQGQNITKQYSRQFEASTGVSPTMILLGALVVGGGVYLATKR